MGNYKEHLFFGFLLAIITLAILYFIFKVDIMNGDLLSTLTIVTLIFSLISDIDNKSANISGFLHFIFILSILAIIARVFPFNFKSIMLVIFIIGLEIYHWSFARDDKTHRQFPHTFTFGLITLIILFLITFSGIALLIGAITLLSHILLDKCFSETIKRDQDLWNKIFSMLKKN